LCEKFSHKKILEEIDLKEMIWGSYINCGDEEMPEKFEKWKGKREEEIGISDAVNPEELKRFSEEIITYDLRLLDLLFFRCRSIKKIKELIKTKFY